MTRRVRKVTFTPGAVLLPCPFCGWVHDGLMEGELWRHLAARHDAASHVARAYAELHALRDERAA